MKTAKLAKDPITGFSPVFLEKHPKNPQITKKTGNLRGTGSVILLSDGKFLHAVDLPGAFGGQAVVHGENLYVSVCWSKEKGQGARLNNSGFIAILDKNNQVISCPGGKPTHVCGWENTTDVSNN